MAQGGFDRNPMMRLTLGLTLALLAGFWVTNALLYFSKMDLTPASVERYYLGSEETYTPPRSYGSMLEVTHGHLAMMALVLLLLTHLVIFVPAPQGLKRGFIWTAFLAALLGEGSGWLVRYVSPAFAGLKVGCFLALQLCLAALLLGLGGFLWRGTRTPGTLTEPPPASRLKRRRKEGRPWQTYDVSQ
jgi:hypothetical protein